MRGCVSGFLPCQWGGAKTKVRDRFYAFCWICYSTQRFPWPRWRQKKRRLGNILVQALGEFVLVNRSAVRWQSSLLPCFGRQTVWLSNLETFPVWNVWKFPSWNFSIFPQFQRTSERCRCPNRSRLALGCVFLLCLFFTEKCTKV